MVRKDFRVGSGEHPAVPQEDGALREWNKGRITRLEDRTTRLRAEEAPILADLRELGYEVESVWDLVKSNNNYDIAVPILIKHLYLSYSDVIRGGLARSLAIPAAKSEWSTLIDLYRNEPVVGIGNGLGAKDGLAAALSAISTDETMEEIVDLAMDASNGSSRVLLLLGIRKSKSDFAKKALMDLASDPVCQKQIALWNKIRTRSTAPKMK